MGMFDNQWVIVEREHGLALADANVSGAWTDQPSLARIFKTREEAERIATGRERVAMYSDWKADLDVGGGR